ARKLRLHFHDLGFGKPANEIDIVNGKVDDHADIGHARWKGSDPGDGNGEDVLSADGLLDRFHRRVETLDVADHERNARVPSRRNDGTSLCNGGCDWLFDEDVNATSYTRQSQFL